MIQVSEIGSHAHDLRICWRRAAAAGWQVVKMRPLVEMPMRPDAIWKRPDEMLMAMEIERQVKSTERYRQKWESFAEMAEFGEVECLLYLCPTVKVLSFVQRAWLRVEEADWAQVQFFLYSGSWV
jgi:hypothetical protein